MKKIRKYCSKRILAGLCTICMLVSLLPAQAFAAGVSPKIEVNGVDIIGATDNTVACGEGTAVYDAGSQTLTLSNATLTEGSVPSSQDYNKFAIWCYGLDSIKIVLKGANTITMDNGIYADGELEISGTESDSINIISDDDGQRFGMASGGTGTSLTIDGAKVDVSIKGGYGVYSANDVQIKNHAVLNGNGGVGAIFAFNKLDISESEVTVTSPGDAALLSTCEIRVSDATLDITGTDSLGMYSFGNISFSGASEVTVSGRSTGLGSGGNMTIDGGKINAASTNNDGIWSNGMLIVGKDAEVTAVGKRYGAAANKDFTIAGSVKTSSKTDIGVGCGGTLTITDGADVDATSEDNYGIYSGNTMSITGASVHAKGGRAAVVSRAIQTASEDAGSKISLTNSMQKSGKLLYTDWNQNSSGKKFNWTTFTPEDATEITFVEGMVDNGLKEVWMAVPYTVTFDVNGGEEEISAAAVYPGEKVKKPEDPKNADYIFQGWYQNNEVFDFDNTAITSDITLKAKWNTHEFGTEWQKDADCHWHKCNEINCTEVSDKSKHTWDNGKVTTKPTSTKQGVKTYTCTVCSQTRTEAMDKLKQSVLTDTKTGITVSYEDGSNLDEDIQLVITPLSKEEMNKYAQSVEEAAKGSTIAVLYDIKLMKDGVEFQPDRKIRITIKMTDEMKNMTDLQVIYIDSTGVPHIIPCEVKDGNITFVVDHFSYYGVIGKAAVSPATGDSSNVLLWLTLLLTSGAGFGVFYIARRNQKFKILS